MASTTIGVKVGEDIRERLRLAADKVGRSPHWLIKQALVTALEQIERGAAPGWVTGEAEPADPPEPVGEAEPAPRPFLEFAQSVRPQSVLRARINAAFRRPEPECLPFLISEASLKPAEAERVEEIARRLATTLRAKAGGNGVEALIQEFSLSSQEGVALMCLAEALLRIPDRPTRDALIRDKIAFGDWRAHLGRDKSLFVNAATWGLVVTGRLTATSSEGGLSSALARLIGRGGEPVIRKGVDIAMRMMGEQFVAGRTISEALANGRRPEAKGFRHSFDMLGEAATTEADARRYLHDYETAIHAIGKASGKRGIYEGPGISIKLSALHPRYSRGQLDRVTGELLPRLKALAVLARAYDIGLNIDAEDAERLDISLDLLEALAFDPELAGWNGIGFVVQAYQKRCPFVIDYLIDLARRSRHRLMVRLVKGAYWDSEIKRAQVDGLDGFPVFTRKVHTDVSYLACARKMLAAPDAIFPQFATHNARTLASIMVMAGPNYYAGQYEFQCLHGMGEPLYEQVVGPENFNRPCRIYAPVGTHETLLAYLVRRLLENGANTSFVNRITDPSVSIDALIADPAGEARAITPPGSPHPAIRLPRELYQPARLNSAGFDLTDEQRLASLSAALLAGVELPRRAAPMVGSDERPGLERVITNPADRRDVVGVVADVEPADIGEALSAASAAAPIWAATPPAERAAILERAADRLEAGLPQLLGPIVREAGKTFANAVGEVREAVDFLRFYALRAREGLAPESHRPLGVVAAISPWNFPLAIFTGQVAAALAAGNPVLAKPAEETPLIAAEAVRILNAAGLPAGVLQLVPGAGDVGAALVADPRVAGVLFTGSTAVAHSIRMTLSARLSADGRPIPLIAETGGLNAMIVDSSALAEQVVNDVIASAFDSAGQRCSALRLLCLQEDVAERVLEMLRGAMAELAIGNPDRLSVDVGPVITPEARDRIEAHVAAHIAAGRPVFRVDMGEETRHGTFVAPTLIELVDAADLKEEVFGPVLHVVRYRRDELDRLIDSINASGYGLTFGLHTRLDETIASVTGRIAAGNLYINRNIIGAVVGVQPFGGHGLSGTGPKAGGPLALARLVSPEPGAAVADLPAGQVPEAARLFAEHLARAQSPAAERVAAFLAHPIVGGAIDLPGPVGERNRYALKPKGTVLVLADGEAGAATAIGAALATGNRVLLPVDAPVGALLEEVPAAVTARIARTPDWTAEIDIDALLFEGESDRLAAVEKAAALLPGSLVQVDAVSPEGLADGREAFRLELLVDEVSISTNTTAAGGNASLMTIG